MRSSLSSRRYSARATKSGGRSISLYWPRCIDFLALRPQFYLVNSEQIGNGIRLNEFTGKMSDY